MDIKNLLIIMGILVVILFIFSFNVHKKLKECSSRANARKNQLDFAFKCIEDLDFPKLATFFGGLYSKSEELISSVKPAGNISMIYLEQPIVPIIPTSQLFGKEIVFFVGDKLLFENKNISKEIPKYKELLETLAEICIFTRNRKVGILAENIAIDFNSGKLVFPINSFAICATAEERKVRDKKNLEFLKKLDI